MSQTVTNEGTGSETKVITTGAAAPTAILSTPGGAGGNGETADASGLTATASSGGSNASGKGKKGPKPKPVCMACPCHSCGCSCHTAKTAKPRRRVTGDLPAPDSALMVNFLQLFGLVHWQDYGKVWTINDVTAEKVQYYLQNIRPELLASNIPTQRAQKMTVEEAQPRDLLTLLKQLGRLYGVKMVSKCRMIHDPVTDKYKSHQEYRFVPMPAEEVEEPATNSQQGSGANTTLQATPLAGGSSTLAVGGQ